MACGLARSRLASSHNGFVPPCFGETGRSISIFLTRYSSRVTRVIMKPVLQMLLSRLRIVARRNGGRGQGCGGIRYPLALFRAMFLAATANGMAPARGADTPHAFRDCFDCR